MYALVSEIRHQLADVLKGESVEHGPVRTQFYKIQQSSNAGQEVAATVA
jgi:hypothetical protein